MIITVGGLTSNTGKTTIATNLAIWLASEGASVLLIDTVESRAASNHAKGRITLQPGATRYNAASVIKPARGFLNSITKEYDHTVIDTGCEDASTTRLCMEISDVVLIPLDRDCLEFNTLKAISEMVDQVQSIRDRKLKAFTFINKLKSGTKVFIDESDFRKKFPGVTLLIHALSDRSATLDSFNNGASILDKEYRDVDPAAALEIEDLFSSMMDASGFVRGCNNMKKEDVSAQSSERTSYTEFSLGCSGNDEGRVVIDIEVESPTTDDTAEDELCNVEESYYSTATGLDGIMEVLDKLLEKAKKAPSK